jgi:hypothetical protein
MSRIDKLPEGCVKIDNWNGRRLYNTYYFNGRLIIECKQSGFKYAKKQMKSRGTPYVFVNAFDGRRVSMGLVKLKEIVDEIKAKEPMKTAEELNAGALAERREFIQMVIKGLYNQPVEIETSEKDS